MGRKICAYCRVYPSRLCAVQSLETNRVEQKAAVGLTPSFYQESSGWAGTTDETLAVVEGSNNHQEVKLLVLHNPVLLSSSCCVHSHSQTPSAAMAHLLLSLNHLQGTKHCIQCCMYGIERNSKMKQTGLQKKVGFQR